MKAADYRFTWQGEEIRVVVAGDVLALPDERWSMGGFGSSISMEWLLHDGRLPGTKARKRMLAECLIRALQAHHEGLTDSDGPPAPRGPFARCPTCKDSGVLGFVIAGGAS